MYKKKIKIAPSILSANFSNLNAEIAEISRAQADYIHIDVMDGHFVPNISIGIPIVESIKKLTKIPLDIHLMIENPAKYIKPFIIAGADVITVHIETDPHMHKILDIIKSLGIKAGVALNPSTSLSTLDEIVYLVDIVLLMSVNPGFGGQIFIPRSLDKIANLRHLLDIKNKEAELEVDGGITTETIGPAVRAGANVLVAGNAIFSKGNIPKSIIDLRNMANSIC